MSIVISEYQKLKEKYSDVILLMKLGDRYYSFEKDANVTAEVLGTVLTQVEGYPTTSFPFGELEACLPELVKAGHRVGISEKIQSS